MIAIIQHFVPDINLELEGLKAAGAKLGIVAPAPPLPGQAPRQSLLPSLEPAFLQDSDPTPAQFEAASERSPSPEPSEFEESEADVTATEDLTTTLDPKLDAQLPAQGQAILDPKLEEQPPAQGQATLEKRNTKHLANLDI
jgi:hypothetical protein